MPDDRLIIATHDALALAASMGIDVEDITGTGNEGKVTVGDVRAYIDAKGVEMLVEVKPEPEPEPAAPTFAEECGFADFPCERSKAVAEELYEKHGEAFVAWLHRHSGGAIPISLLLKVASVECAGGKVKKLAHASIKERTA